MNANKTEVIWFVPKASFAKLDVIQPVSVVRDLGVLDANLTMKQHVNVCYYQLYGD